MTDFKHIFGPVPSRRLGRSLGIDLTPRKTCTFDCVYCQLGRTVHKTLRRKEYVPTERVIKEFRDWMEKRTEVDYITLSGSGEPTLHSRFGDVIREAKSRADAPVALLTNGSLLGGPVAAREAADADLIKVSLSAWDQESLEAVNRPHPDIVFAELVSGIRRQRELFSGELWIEVFVVPGLNSKPEQMDKIAELVKTIYPDRVQLNTAVRPPAEPFVRIAPSDELAMLATSFTPPAEVIADYTGRGSTGFRTASQTIKHILERRPCTAEQMAAVSGLHRAEISKHLGRLLHQGELRAIRRRNETYFEARSSRETQHA